MTHFNGTRRIIATGVVSLTDPISDRINFFYRGRFLMAVTKQRVEDEPLEWLACEVEVMCHIRDRAYALHHQLKEIISGGE